MAIFGRLRIVKRAHAAIAVALVAAGLGGCINSRLGGVALPHRWIGPIPDSKDCRMIQGVYSGIGEGAPENPTQWSDMFKWPRSGQLLSLIERGINEKATPGRANVNINLGTNDTVEFQVLNDKVMNPDARLPGGKFKCESGRLHASWINHVSALWGKFHTDVWLFTDADRNLIAEKRDQIQDC